MFFVILKSVFHILFNMKNTEFQNINVAVIKTVFAVVCILAVLLLIILALYFYNTKGEFLSAISLGYDFYLPVTIITFLFVAFLYTPVSFGISDYFISPENKRSFVKCIFYIYLKPHLFFKLVRVSVLKYIIVLFLRFIVLLIALLIECAVFILCVVLSGENIFVYEHTFLQSTAEFFINNKFLVIFTVIEWALVLFCLFYIKIRYIFCKYVLLCNSYVGAVETIRIGNFVISGNVSRTIIIYIKYISIYIISFVTMGKFTVKNSGSFSDYAVSTVKEGMKRYFEQC